MDKSPEYLITNKKWSKLYDANHPLYKHFTRKNLVNFAGQKSAAKKRGIPFNFDFPTWIEWWCQTGKFYERGVLNHQYQMCRKGDIGAYEWDNVYCDTGKNNKLIKYNQYNPKYSVIIDGVNYDSIADAARKLNIKRTTLNQRLNRYKKINEPIVDRNKGKNNPMYNKKHSVSTLEKMKEKIVCPHCNLEGGKSTMKRYHFDKCKYI